MNFIKPKYNNVLVNIGKNQYGKNHYQNLTELPNLLVLGKTGSGKSTLLHSIITDIAKNHKETVQVGIIDCKGVEFQIYEKLPNLIYPVATKKQFAVDLLNHILQIMEERYCMFQSLKIKNIQQYNETHEDKLPYILVVIDELAEIMFDIQAKKSINNLINSAHTYGIHLIMATVRLKEDTIPNEVIENKISIICFKLENVNQLEKFSKFSSGASLSDKGEMLFYKYNYEKPLKLQGSFKSFKEITNIINDIKVK